MHLPKKCKNKHSLNSKLYKIEFTGHWMSHVSTYHVHYIPSSTTSLLPTKIMYDKNDSHR